MQYSTWSTYYIPNAVKELTMRRVTQYCPLSGWFKTLLVDEWVCAPCCSDNSHLSMKSLLDLSALLLISSPVFPQHNGYDDCVFNKESEIQRWESDLQEAFTDADEAGLVDSFRERLSCLGQLPKDMTASVKKERAPLFIEGSIKVKQNHIDVLEVSLDYSTSKWLNNT